MVLNDWHNPFSVKVRNIISLQFIHLLNILQRMNVSLNSGSTSIIFSYNESSANESRSFDNSTGKGPPSHNGATTFIVFHLKWNNLLWFYLNAIESKLIEWMNEVRTRRLWHLVNDCRPIWVSRDKRPCNWISWQMLWFLNKLKQREMEFPKLIIDECRSL